MNREQAHALLKEFVENENLRSHCEMVAMAMESYSEALELSADESEQWWLAGLLHDLDWEKFPDEHPKKALNDIFPKYDLSPAILGAIESHAPQRTGRQPESQIERYLFACDELSGFMNAVSILRPNGFKDMKPKSVTKKLKDKKFAEAVSRNDIRQGAELIEKELNEHIAFLIETFNKQL